MAQLEYLPIALIGIGIIVSILYYTSVLRNANKTQKLQLETNQTHLSKSAGAMDNYNKMDKLVLDVFNSFNNIREKLDVITYPSFPILYLGDYPEYMRSKLKIITVGINPSINEIPTEVPVNRFKELEELDTLNKLTHNEMLSYYSTLNDFFKTTQYKRFNSYEYVLKGLYTSYYENTTGNKALHTWLCSNLVTEKPWSKLKDSEKYTLSLDGRKIWYTLIENLVPDIILFSVPFQYIQRLKFKKSGWSILKKITEKNDGTPRQSPYEVLVTDSKILDKHVPLVYGPLIQQPFGTLSNKARFEIGYALRRKLKES